MMELVMEVVMEAGMEVETQVVIAVLAQRDCHLVHRRRCLANQTWHSFGGLQTVWTHTKTEIIT